MLNLLEPPIQSTKLSREAFTKALRHGRGSVAMHVRDHGMEGVEDLVLAACLENQSYDCQCEGSRAEWMYSLFNESPAHARFVEPILAAVARSTDDYDGEQVCELASLMGRDGDLEAAATLRTFVRGQAFSDERIVGASAMCALDGMSAVVEIARRVGKVLEHDPEAWMHSLDVLIDDDLPFDEVFAELRQLASGDGAIAAYVAREDVRIAGEAATERSDQERSAEVRRHGEEFIRQNPVEVILAASAGESRSRGLFLRFGRWASDDDLNRVLDHLRIQSDPAVCTKLLWIFRKAALPCLDQRVWELASHSSAEVRNAAVVALSGISDPRVHELGRERLGDPTFSSEFSEEIELFKHNFEPGDETLILAALKRQPVDGDEAHALGSSALDVCASVRSPALARVAQWVYRTNPCTICRRLAVELLREWDSLPAHIAAECRYDASGELRALFSATA